MLCIESSQQYSVLRDMLSNHRPRVMGAPGCHPKVVTARWCQDVGNPIVMELACLRRTGADNIWHYIMSACQMRNTPRFCALTRVLMSLSGESGDSSYVPG